MHIEVWQLCKGCCLRAIAPREAGGVDLGVAGSPGRGPPQPLSPASRAGPFRLASAPPAAAITPQSAPGRGRRDLVPSPWPRHVFLGLGTPISIALGGVDCPTSVHGPALPTSGTSRIGSRRLYWLELAACSRSGRDRDDRPSECHRLVVSAGTAHDLY